jgi:hypothetical protein
MSMMVVLSMVRDGMSGLEVAISCNDKSMLHIDVCIVFA